MNNRTKTFHTICHLLIGLLFTAASALPVNAQNRAEEKLLVETTAGNRFNSYPTFEAYKNAGTTASVINKKLRTKPQPQGNTLFVIYGVDLEADGFKNGDFIWAGDLAMTDIGDSDFDGLSLPITGAVISFRKSTIGMLAPDADRYIIDGKEASQTEFEALADAEIQCVTILGKTLLVKKRFITDENIDNIDVKKASDDESHLMRLCFSDPTNK